MSPVLRKPVFGVSDQVRHKPAVHPQKMARGLEFRILEVEGLYYPCSENKGADQLRGYREADLRLCFRICKKPVFSQRGSYVRIHSHGKIYTHLFVHSIDIRMRIVYIMVQTCVNVYAMCTHWLKIIRIINLMILLSLFHP